MSKNMNKNYSNFKAMFAITRASLLSIVRNPSSVIFTLLFPLIFIVVFGFISSGTSKYDIAFYNKSDKENPIYQNLVESTNLKLVENPSDTELESQLEKGKIEALLLITKNPAGTNPPYTIEVKTNKSTPERAALTRMIITHFVDAINAKSLPEAPKVAEIKEAEVTGRIYKMIDFILPGQLGFSILSAGVFGTAFVLLSLRETLVIKRFFATPINRKFIVIGEGISRLIFSLGGSAIIILIGYLFFSFTLINGAVTFINMMIVSAIGLIVFLGFGFVVSNISKNVNSVPAIANLITLPQFLLAGTFFPIDNFPSWLQPVSRALPLTYLNDALRKISFEGAGLFSLQTDLLFLCGWGVIIYALAIIFFKWE
jgi:ABC-2 type transport system permease protein